jgi:hypothetical protein
VESGSAILRRGRGTVKPGGHHSGGRSGITPERWGRAPDLFSAPPATLADFAFGIALAMAGGHHPATGRTEMTNRALAIGVVVLALATSSAHAAGLTERVQSERMTVVKVDAVRGRFLCAEHGRWMRVSGADAPALGIGDIVTLQRREGQPPRVTVVRTAADELTSPE